MVVGVDSVTITRKQEEINQVSDRRDQSRDVSERGGVKHAVHPLRFLATMNEPHVLQNDLGARRGIKLHGQSDQLKRRESEEAPEADLKQPGEVEEPTGYE